jgi:hypothetical protein
VALSLSAGCASRKPPTYAWVDTDTAIAHLVRQDSRLQSISATGMVTLTDPKNNPLRLAAMLVAKFPDYLRLRCWNSGEVAFDLTLKPEGVWMLVPEGTHGPEARLPAMADAADLARAWPSFHGDFFTALNQEIDDRFGKTFWLQRRLANGSIVRCEVDRSTLTVIGNQLLDRQGKQRFSVAYERYARVDDLAVPHRIVATGPQGAIVIDLVDVQVNRPTPSGAFVPPERAERLR